MSIHTCLSILMASFLFLSFSRSVSLGPPAHQAAMEWFLLYLPYVLAIIAIIIIIIYSIREEKKP